MSTRIRMKIPPYGLKNTLLFLLLSQSLYLSRISSLIPTRESVVMRWRQLDTVEPDQCVKETRSYSSRHFTLIILNMGQHPCIMDRVRVTSYLPPTTTVFP